MSKKFSGALIGAAAGFFMSGGLFGALIGGMLGNMFDNTREVSTRQRSTSARGYTRENPRVREFVFVSNLVALMTSVAKADNEIHPAEVNAIVSYFEKNLKYTGHDRRVIENLIREAAARQLDVRKLCYETRNMLQYPERLMLLRMLYIVAFSDRVFKDSEKKRIEEIVDYLQIHSVDHEHIKREFSITSTIIEDNYKVLEMTSSASDAEIKSAYREMVKKYHPDRVQHLGKEFADLANEKFKKVQAAYDKISKERGI